MRFENLPYEKQIAFMRRLHTRLNKCLFKGELEPVEINIENLDKSPTGLPAPLGMFVNKEIALCPIGQSKILFHWSVIDFVNGLKSQQQQLYQLSGLMLHEMIHQYCYEKNIDEGDHNDAWQAAARKHGLISVYENGKLISETIDFPLSFCVCNMKIQ